MAANQSPPIDLNTFTFDARPDTIDFRDQMYVPTLTEVPMFLDLETYQQVGVPILSQGSEGACTGFGLATVANYLLHKRRVVRDETPVSMRMLYEMAKRYDEWPGVGYSGSSARGAMKGWHKHGVCAESLWKYQPGEVDRVLTDQRARDAGKRPLGAYFRVNHKDLVAMHTALAEVGILFVTANVHEGWGSPKANGEIPFKYGNKITGGHAFALVGYNERGFWIQNSWSNGWGKGGYALLTYDDWLANGMDVWVARLGVPVTRLSAEATAETRSPGAKQAQSYAYSDLRPHIISLGNDGSLRDWGTYGTSQDQVEVIFKEDIPRITQKWDRKRILLYAHGGLVGEAGFVQRIAEYRSTLLKAQVYPLAFVWHTDFWSTVTNILQDAANQRRPEGFLDDALDFMLDRLDDTLEPLVRALKGKILWDEMKENAWLATQSQEGGARFVLKLLADLVASEPDQYEVHLAGHSAGSIFHAPLIQLLSTRGMISTGKLAGSQGLGVNVASCTLWAPGISIQDFKQTYLPAIQNGSVERFSLFTLTDEAEQDDQCAHIYNKSLLYLVANALEEQRGTPLLGMEKYVQPDPDLNGLFKNPNAVWVKAPNDFSPPKASKSRHHGDFDDDVPTMQSTLATILQSRRALPGFEFSHSASSLRDKRLQLE